MKKKLNTKSKNDFLNINFNLNKIDSLSTELLRSYWTLHCIIKESEHSLNLLETLSQLLSCHVFES